MTLQATKFAALMESDYKADKENRRGASGPMYGEKATALLARLCM